MGCGMIIDDTLYAYIIIIIAVLLRLFGSF